jgi:RNA polymerase sigma-70 factor (ECF subfamily)
MTDADMFQTYRPVLFGIAYRMLGSASDAEDVLQNAYLRYNAAETHASAGPRDEIRSPKAYFSTIATRCARAVPRHLAARTGTHAR